MPVTNVVRGQYVNPGMLDRAKLMRRELTPAERILWNALRRNQIDGFHFRRQQVIDGYIVDFYCHAAALVVEVDGDVHDQQQEYDAHREKVLQARGLRVLRFRNERVMGDLQGVLREIVRACLDG